MAAIPRNPVRLVRRVDTFPDPTAGLVVFHTGFDEYFLSDGDVWVTAGGGGIVLPFGNAIGVRTLTMLVNGVVELFDVSSGIRPLGVVQAIHEDECLVRYIGLVHGFSDLSPGATQYASTGVGEIVEEPDPAASLVRVGQAITSSILAVQLDQPVFS